MKNIFKKLSVISLLSLIISLSISYINPLPSFAADGGRGLGQKGDSFLGLNPWDYGINPNVDSEDVLKSNIWIIASNIAVDISVIAAYLVLGYVIYGGYQYTFSNGDPGKVANGKKTLTQAFIGLAITMSANLIMSSLRIALVGGNGNIGNCVSSGGCGVTPDDLVNNLVGWIIGVAGVVSVIFLIFGAIQYITSTGDPGKLKKAKDTILYSLIGLAIVGLAIAITAFVSGIIRDANENAIINNKTISKEVHEKIS